MSEVFERTFVLLGARPHLCRARAWAAGMAMIHIAAEQAAYRSQWKFLLTMPLPLGPWKHISATKLLPHAGRHHPSTCTFGGVSRAHQHGMAAKGHVRIRGAEHQGAGRPPRRRIGSRESRAAHQTPCRLHVPAFLVQPRVSKRFRRGNTMPSFSHNLTCKRSPSISGRPSRHTLC